MPGWLGPWELLILAVVLLVVFGPKRVPQVGRSLGKGLREFKHAITGKSDEAGQVEAPREPDDETRS